MGNRLLEGTRKVRGRAGGIGATVVVVRLAWALLARSEVRGGRPNRQPPTAAASLRACVRARVDGLGNRLLEGMRRRMPGGGMWGRRRKLSRASLRTPLPARRVTTPWSLAAHGFVRWEGSVGRRAVGGKGVRSGISSLRSSLLVVSTPLRGIAARLLWYISYYLQAAPVVVTSAPVTALMTTFCIHI